jgi:paraquat-inducible protein B
MADLPRRPDPIDIPDAVAAPKSRHTIQLVWIVPLVAVLIGGWLAVKSILDKGPTITITLESADGIEAGKTKIKYKDVDVGLVSDVGFAKGTLRVLVTAELGKGTVPYLLDDARFWVARPRISGGTVSGLGTLLSGPYIGMDVGRKGRPTREFTALKEPPAFTSDMPGREFVLHTDNLGSVDVGSPIYFRRLQAGLVTGYELDKDGKGVTVRVFVNVPYDKFVTGNTRFWQASGIDMTLDARGVKIETQSVTAILIGGLAFETPLDSVDLPPAAAKAEFRLFANRADALKNPEQDAVKWILVFNESIRGLAVGAPVDFRGIELGYVTAIKVDLDRAERQVHMVIEVETFPSRMRVLDIASNKVLTEEQNRAFVDSLISNGLRGQLRSGNLLTGQLYVAVDIFPNAPKPKLLSKDPQREIPTIPNSLSELQSTLAGIAGKIQAFPLKEIGDDVRQTLQAATKMADAATKIIGRMDTEIAPEARAVLAEGREAIMEARKAIASAESVLKPDSPLSQDARDAMHELARTAAAFRVLADYLERHPEALISGKKDGSDKKEPSK